MTTRSSHRRSPELGQALIVLAWAVTLSLTAAALYLARDIIVPLIIAAGLWLIVNALADVIGRVRIGAFALPFYVRALIAVLVILGLVTGVAFLVGDNAALFRAKAESYRARWPWLRISAI